MSTNVRSSCLIRIVDDEPEVRRALAFMLASNDWDTVAYESARDFISTDRPSQPGCLLLDIRMPGMSGTELQKLMKEREINLPIIFITGHADVDTAVATLKAGAFDFLQKPVEGEKLNKVIEEACSVSLAQSQGKLSTDELIALYKLMSPREKEIAALVGRGMASGAISAELGLSERTVQGHKSIIYHKLRVHSVKQLLEVLERLPDEVKQ